MKYLSLCSGIEAASVAWPEWEAVAFSEIDAFPAAVLKHRFPNVPNWGDITKYDEWPDVSIDLICGGTPCQSFSIAGLRKGLDDERGNLMLTFGHILGKYRPAWFIWENVPGVLSSDEGRDFASFLGLVTGQAITPPIDGWRNSGAISGIESAYGIAYRVLDAQYTRSPNHPRAVPQRRRRVFVVGHLGDWRPAAAVLLDSESLSRDPPPRRETGQRVAPAVTSGPPFGRTGNERIEAEAMVVVKGSHWDGAAHPPLTQSHSSSGIAMSDQELFAQRGAGLVACPLTSNPYGDHESREGLLVPTIAIRTAQTSANGHGLAEEVAHTLDQVQGQAVAFHPTQDPISSTEYSHAVGTGSKGGQASVAVALTLRQREGCAGGGKGPLIFNEHSGTLATSNDQTLLTPQMAVRRLIPVETERLQGFEDDHTNVPYRGKATSPDGPRYKAIGNSMATNCMEWIGLRIEHSSRAVET